MHQNYSLLDQVPESFSLITSLLPAGDGQILETCNSADATEAELFCAEDDHPKTFFNTCFLDAGEAEVLKNATSAEEHEGDPSYLKHNKQVIPFCSKF